MPDVGCRRLCEAADMRLINEAVLHRSVEGLVAFPIVTGRIYDNGAHGRLLVVLGRAGAVAIPKRIRIAAGVWIDQHFVSVEALPSGVKPAIDTVGVVRSRLQTEYKGMPKVEGLVYIGIES